MAQAFVMTIPHHLSFASVLSLRHDRPQERRQTDHLVADIGVEIGSAEKFIDYAVMERTALGAVLPVSFRWSDIGSWNAVWDAPGA